MPQGLHIWCGKKLRQAHESDCRRPPTNTLASQRHSCPPLRVTNQPNLPKTESSPGQGLSTIKSGKSWANRCAGQPYLHSTSGPHVLSRPSPELTHLELLHSNISSTHPLSSQSPEVLHPHHLIHLLKKVLKWIKKRI